MRNSTYEMAKKICGYFHNMAISLAIIGILFHFLPAPELYDMVVSFFEEIDPLAIFRGGRPSDLNNFVTK